MAIFKINDTKKSIRKIAIIGGGFAGICFAAHLAKFSHSSPLELFIFEKTGAFGTGDAYRTPFSFHLLNVRAKDMSIFVQEPQHFIKWLKDNANLYLDLSLDQIEERFVPRLLYRHYLMSVLKNIPNLNLKLHLVPEEVLAVWPTKPWTVQSSQQTFYVDEVVLATGNEAPDQLPFKIQDTNVIENPWHYQRLTKIPIEDNILIVGTGLSMIDAVLTLHHQNHQGIIYGVSRRGLLPLPHSDAKLSGLTIDPPSQTLTSLLKWSRAMSERYQQAGLDWQLMINTLRPKVTHIWQSLTLKDKQSFLRHLLPYWNIHRHRVPQTVAMTLNALKAKNQLHILGGRIHSVANQVVRIKHKQSMLPTFKVQWVVNCIGPQATFKSALYQHLFEQKLAEPDAVRLGLAINADGALVSPLVPKIYTLGALRKGTLFETNAVPEIRQQCHDLATHLLD